MLANVVASTGHPFISNSPFRISDGIIGEGRAFQLPPQPDHWLIMDLGDLYRLNTTIIYSAGKGSCVCLPLQP